MMEFDKREEGIEIDYLRVYTNILKGEIVKLYYKKEPVDVEVTEKKGNNIFGVVVDSHFYNKEVMPGQEVKFGEEHLHHQTVYRDIKEL